MIRGRGRGGENKHSAEEQRNGGDDGGDGQDCEAGQRFLEHAESDRNSLISCRSLMGKKAWGRAKGTVPTHSHFFLFRALVLD